MLEPVTAFIAQCAASDGASDGVAAAFQLHLAMLTADQLPPEARLPWQDVARLLKAAPDVPVPERAILAIRSWPAARAGTLLERLHQIRAILDRLENERWEDDIRDKIRHTYL